MPIPTVVLIPGIGMFSFGKSKTEARLTGEFYVNAIHVMEGATSMDTGSTPATLPQAGAAAPTSAFTVHANYVALPPSEAFRIEYWQLEEAKIRRQPPEKELSRHVVLIVGGGSGIGREAALLAAERGAHVVVADRDHEAAKKVAEEAKAIAGKEGWSVGGRGHSPARRHTAEFARSGCRLWRSGHPDQHRRALPLLERRTNHRRAVGSDARRECHGKLSSG